MQYRPDLSDRAFMATPATTSIQMLLRQAASLLLYQAVLADEVGQAFVDLLQSFLQSDSDGLKSLQAYGRWFKALAVNNQSWQDYLLTQILRDNNPFTQKVQVTPVQELPKALIAAAQQDLQSLQILYQCSSEQLSHWVQVAAKVSVAPIAWHQEQNSNSKTLAQLEGCAVTEQSYRERLKQLNDWADGVEILAEYYQQFSTGLFTQYRAFRWQSGQLLGIAHPDAIELTQLVGYESQKQALVKNTEILLAGYPALHVLLYGSRGNGKSSLVKGLLNQYGDKGLRLIEVGKSELKGLPTLQEQLRNVPLKFIIFVDDFSFEEDDDDFKSLKAVLEGNITARSQNVVVYATSNRRHLVREFFEDRPRPKDSDEIHTWDTVQEKLSFSDRFGLTLTFEPANQETYLQIIRHLAEQSRILLSDNELEYRALQWATRHNGRSGRTARQFIDFLRGDLALSSNGANK